MFTVFSFIKSVMSSNGTVVSLETSTDASQSNEARRQPQQHQSNHWLDRLVSREKLVGIFLGLSFLILAPYLHLGFFFKFWTTKKPVDEYNCKCSCWDTIFKGSYESSSNPGYHHIYFSDLSDAQDMGGDFVLCFSYLWDLQIRRQALLPQKTTPFHANPSTRIYLPTLLQLVELLQLLERRLLLSVESPTLLLYNGARIYHPRHPHVRFIAFSPPVGDLSRDRYRHRPHYHFLRRPVLDKHHSQSWDVAPKSERRRLYDPRFDQRGCSHLLLVVARYPEKNTCP